MHERKILTLCEKTRKNLPRPSCIRNFETKVYDLEYTIKHLKTQKLKDQILFHTNKSLEYIKFIESIEVMINE